jgi:hypothetical protein
MCLIKCGHLTKYSGTSNLKGPEKKFELRKLRITENTQKIQEKSVFVNFKVR